MKPRHWKRQEVISSIRRDIWRFITPASREDQILLLAASLLQMSESEVRFLAQLHFIRSEVVGRLLEEMPSLLRRLTNTIASETEISAQRVRGPIKWGETYSERAARGIPNLFVTAPTHRAFNTPENEVLAFALRSIVDVGKRTGWHHGAKAGPAAEIHRRVAEATRWLQSREFIDLARTPLNPTTVSRVRAGRNRRRYQVALDVVNLHERFISRLDRGAIRESVETRGLVASSDDVLLELLCAFDVIKSLRNSGWHSVAPPALVGPALQQALLFTGTRDGYTLEVTYQATPKDLSTGSLYGEVRRTHGLGAGGLKPDVVIRVRKGGYDRWLLIEVKGGRSRNVSNFAREATLDLFGYRRAFKSVLDDQEEPYGLGYVWGEAISPSTNCDVTLCTPDTLPEALELLLSVS